MGKNNWPDFDAIIQKAVNAGRAQGMSIAKDAYKATERRLYALPVLRQKVEDDKEKLEQIKTQRGPGAEQEHCAVQPHRLPAHPGGDARGHHQRPRGHHSGG